MKTGVSLSAKPHSHFTSGRPVNPTPVSSSSGRATGPTPDLPAHKPIPSQHGPGHLPPGLPLPARGLLIVGLPLMLPIEEAFHLGRCCLLGPGWQGGSTLGRKCRFGLAVRGGRGNGTGLFGARPLLGSTVDHFTCVHGFCHLGTLERPFS